MKEVKDDDAAQLDDWVCDCAQVDDVIEHAILLVRMSRLTQKHQHLCTISSLVSLALAIKIGHEMVAAAERQDNGKQKGNEIAKEFMQDIFQTTASLFDDLGPEIMHRFVSGVFVREHTIQ